MGERYDIVSKCLRAFAAFFCDCRNRVFRSFSCCCFGEFDVDVDLFLIFCCCFFFFSLLSVAISNLDSDLRILGFRHFNFDVDGFEPVIVHNVTCI